MSAGEEKRKETFVVAEGVERIHHFAKNKQGLKTLELQRPNLSHSPCPESMNFIIGFIYLFIYCFSLCAAVSQRRSQPAFNHLPDEYFDRKWKKNVVFVYCLRLFGSRT